MSDQQGRSSRRKRSRVEAARQPDTPLRQPDGPQAFRWRLVGRNLPKAMEALRIGEASRAMVYRAADQRGMLPLPDSFHNARHPRHSHAFWLPEDADADGLIDHVVVFAESGLPEDLIPILALGGQVHLGALGEWRLAPDWMGQRAPGALFGPARVWIAATPYVSLPAEEPSGSGPIGRERAEEQLRNEIAQRRLPARLMDVIFDTEIVREGLAVPAKSFSLSAHGRRRAPAGALALGARIVFQEPVFGPLAFGFNAHFGLGLFEPAD